MIRAKYQEKYLKKVLISTKPTTLHHIFCKFIFISEVIYMIILASYNYLYGFS